MLRLFSYTSFPRRASLGISVLSMAYWQNAKTVPSTPCLSELYRLYATSTLDSYIDLCLYPFPNVVVGNETISYLKEVTIGTGPGAIKVPMNVTQLVNQYWCTNCPLGPFLDYSNLVRLTATRATAAALTKTRNVFRTTTRHLSICRAFPASRTSATAGRIST